ncbi:MAG: DarT ssDNA thymidine ADP-ribosyltransferase family protein [Burkholderiaceae bacterium]
MNTALVPPQPRIYHVAHVDRLPSIVADGFLWCDAEVIRRAPAGTSIGMSRIKQRRLHELRLGSHPHLYVGDCVPFYFCPRSGDALSDLSGQPSRIGLSPRARTNPALRG